jgi:hypothetical protein
MKARAEEMLRAMGWMGALASIGALAACNPFPKDEAGPLRIDRVMAVDLAVDREPVTSSERPGTAVALDGVPLNDALIRIEFNRTLDPSSVQRDPAGTERCRPASNIAVDITSTTATPAGYHPRAVQAQVCYSPNGFAPAIVVQPALPGCGPVPLGTLEPGLQYRISAKGVRDLAGNALDFTVTVTAAAFGVADAMVETSADPVILATGDAEPGTVPTTPAPVTSYSVLAALGTGSYYGPTAAHAVPGRETGVPVYVSPSLDPAAAYGPFIDLFFDSRTCPAGAEALCRGPVNLRVQGQAEPILVKGTASGPPDPNAPSIPASTLVMPIFPLEDGQTYTLTVGAGWKDANGSGLYSTQQDWVGTFKTDQGLGRLVWAAPASARDASNNLPATEYLTLDPKLIQDWSGGRPGTGIATSAPITAGDPTLSGPLSPSCASDLVTAPYAGDGRNRTRLFQCASDLLPLQADTDYAVSAGGLVVGSDTLPDGTQAEFHTLPFGNDPAFNGFVNSPQIVLEEGPGSPSSHPATIAYEAPSGLVYGPVYSGQSADVAVTNGSGNAPIAYLVSFTGKVQYDSGPSLGQSGGFTYHALVTPGGAEQAEVTLVELAQDGVTPLGSAIPATMAGYLTIGAQDPWTARHYPGSLIGFVPTSPLAFGTSYRLRAVVYAEGSTTATTADLVFATTPFQVTTVRRIDAKQADKGIFPPVDADPELRQIATGDTFLVRTTGLVDGAAFASSPATGQAIQVRETATWTEVPVLLQLASNGKYVSVVPSALTPGTNYTLSITSLLLSEKGTAEQGTAIRPGKYTFSASDDRLVCE